MRETTEAAEGLVSEGDQPEAPDDQLAPTDDAIVVAQGLHLVADALIAIASAIAKLADGQVADEVEGPPEPKEL